MNADQLIEKINLFFPAKLRPEYVALVNELRREAFSAGWYARSQLLKESPLPGWDVAFDAWIKL